MLTNRQSMVLTLRREYSLEEIAKEFGVTRQAVWSIEKKARRNIERAANEMIKGGK